MNREEYIKYLDLREQLEAVARARLKTKYIFKIIAEKDVVTVWYIPDNLELDRTELLDATTTHNIKYFKVENFIGE